MGIVDNIVRVITGVEPVFTFMSGLWYCFPISFRLVFATLFGAAITFVVLKMFVL